MGKQMHPKMKHVLYIYKEKVYTIEFLLFLCYLKVLSDKKNKHTILYNVVPMNII